jgi:hypothetical protein
LQFVDQVEKQEKSQKSDQNKADGPDDFAMQQAANGFHAAPFS